MKLCFNFFFLNGVLSTILERFTNEKIENKKWSQQVEGGEVVRIVVYSNTI